MKKNSIISSISLLMAFLIAAGVLASCINSETTSTETESSSITEGESTSSSTPPESEGSSSNVESSREEESSENESSTPIVLEGENGAIIQHASAMANGVQTYYNADRSAYTIQNLYNSIDYTLSNSKPQMVAAYKNSQGVPYFTDSMDVFVTKTSGANSVTYYASNSTDQARVNLYRLGYYYYDVHILEQDFIGSVEVDRSTDIPINKFSFYKHTSKPVINDGVMSATITNQADPQFYANVDYSTELYNNLQFQFKGDAVGSLTIYIIAGDATGHTDAQSIVIETAGSADFATYNVPLNSTTIPGYKGQIKSIRIDFGGAVNTSVHLKDVKLQNVEIDSVPLSIDRIFHTFPDKVHQELHFVAYQNTKNIEAVGIEIKFPYDTVASILVKDKNGITVGTRTELKNVDWDSAEYVAFDVKGAGVIGFILPYDGNSGKLNVKMMGGSYVLTQSATPPEGIINAPINSTVNDFSIGHRIYTDETHDFAGFLEAAYCERTPLTEDNIVIDAEKFARGAKLKGYDPLRGVYHISLKGAPSFNDPYYNNQNLYYNASFSITGDDHDRDIYIMTYTSSGLLECAVLMDENNVLLPIALQVSKNFSEHEEPFYNCGDAGYGETFFPVSLKAGEEKYFTVLNLYQNWGNFPLKQLSSIGYYMPYYHLSTGVTESNCISPWYNRGKNLWTLPDHRSMSMPKSSDLENKYASYGNQPQTPNAGYHMFLQYTDADGNYYASEYVDNVIHSYGPTYADLSMNYLSDDGKIKVTLRHMEMPQTDENRGYYALTYEVLDTVTIDNFLEDFSFYTMTGFSNYKKVGYLSSKNEPAVTDTRADAAKPIALGNECPYFSMFYLPGNNAYTNLSFLIYDSSMIIGGKELTDYQFALMNGNNALRLTLLIKDKVTLQAGDRMTIYAIIMPWGGGYIPNGAIDADGDGKLDVYHPMDDTNVQNVRLNTLLNPFKATAKDDCKEVNSTFLPRVESTNGKSATFTVTGGCDIYEDVADKVNVTVRVDGFTTLARPKIEELIDGAWVIHNISTSESPDSAGHTWDFDGYQVHYDGDGTYSYSFVVTITDGQSRTFRVTAE